MDAVIEIKDSQGKLLAYKIGAKLQSGLTAYSKDQDFIQLMSWRYGKGTVLKSHVHREFPRTSYRTQEAIVVLSGRLRADIYDESQQLVTSVSLERNECMVFLAGGHGYEILEDETKVYEIKNGPYLGVEADKIKF